MQSTPWSNFGPFPPLQAKQKISSHCSVRICTSSRGEEKKVPHKGETSKSNSQRRSQDSIKDTYQIVLEVRSTDYCEFHKNKALTLGNRLHLLPHFQHQPMSILSQEGKCIWQWRVVVCWGTVHQGLVNKMGQFLMVFILGYSKYINSNQKNGKKN